METSAEPHPVPVPPLGRGRQIPGRLLLESSRWLLVACLVYAPWAYGSTRPETKAWLVHGLLWASAIFVLGLVVTGRRPRIPAIPAVASTMILLQGWIMTLNPLHFFEPGSGLFYDLVNRVSWLPGTFNRYDSESQMWLVTGLVGAFAISCDLWENRTWRFRLFFAMAAIGISIVALGILQHLSGASAIFWGPRRTSGRTFFATYRYHANAGAFINLVLPLVAAIGWIKWRSGSPFSKLFWTISTLIVAASVYLHVSRAASVIGTLVLLGLGVSLTAVAMRQGRRLLPPLLGLAVLLAIVATLAFAFGADRLADAWTGKKSIAKNARFLVYSVVVTGMVPEAGAWGFGPGTFHITFPYFTAPVGKALRGYWATAHSDYLQTLVEWGWVGSIFWFLLVPGALLRGILRLRRGERGPPGHSALLIGASCLSLAGVLLHASVDFPLQIASLQLFTACLVGFLWASDGRRALGDDGAGTAGRNPADGRI